MSGLRLHRTTLDDPARTALLERADGPVGIAGVVSDLNRHLDSGPAPGFAVDRAYRFDTADQRDHAWWPQGLTTLSDATGTGTRPLIEGWEQRQIVLNAWYAKDPKGRHLASRVTVSDVEALRYRHVLLVRPRVHGRRIVLEPLPVHAGGLLWAGEHLHIAATAKGFYTARVADLCRLPSRRAVRGHHGYRYVLPVRWHHRPSAEPGHEPLRYSFFSLVCDDPEQAGPRMLIGEYGRDGKSQRLAEVALDPNTLLPALDASGAAAPRLLGDGVGHMQGALRIRGRFYVTTSHGQLTPGSVLSGQLGSLDRRRFATPMGPEDLSYDHRNDEIWSVSEHPWRRWLYAMSRSAFD